MKSVKLICANGAAGFFLLLGAAGLWSCGVTESTTFESEYVVEAYLFAREPLPELRLSRTVPFGTPFIFDQQAVGRATVRIDQVNAAGDVERTFNYIEQERGVYLPAPGDSLARVQPLHRYALEIRIPDDDRIVSAVTLVPDTFSIVAAGEDTIVYQSTQQFEIRVTQSSYPGRQNVYVFSTEYLDTANLTVEQLTPFFRDFFDEDEDDLEDFRISESPLINEENYDQNPDGTVTIKLPWLAVNFYGPNRISANAVDDNLFDFIRSQDIQNNPSTLSPGEIPNVLDPIENGTGIFGSYARVEKEIFIARP